MAGTWWFDPLGNWVPIGDKVMTAAEGTLETGTHGLPAQPEAEKRPRTTATAEEVNGEALGDSSDDAAPISPDSSVPSAAVEELSITRATMALRIEPWRLLPPGEARDEHARGHNGNAAARAACPACQLSHALFEVQRECAGAYNFTARNLERLDGAFWDNAKLAAKGSKIVLPTERVVGRDKPQIAWPSHKYNAYQDLRAAFPLTVAGTMSAIANEVVSKWRKERWSVLATMERSAARWKRETTPIPVRAADCTLTESTESRDLFHLHCSLRSGRRQTRGKEFAIPLRAKDQRQYRDLREIARVCAGDAAAIAKMGAVEIKRDRIGRHWALRIAYSRIVTRKTVGKLGAINRGIACILALSDEDGYSYVYDGNDIEAYLKQMQARRRAYQNTLKFSGRKGRGRGHALAPTDVLEGQAARWRATTLQRIAREAAKWCRDRGITHVLIDDLTGIRDGAVESLVGGKLIWDRIQEWPYYQLGGRLAACLDELGIGHSERPVAFASRDCPSCGVRHEGKNVERTFKCAGCGYSRHIDVVFGLNLIQREQLRAAVDSAVENPTNAAIAIDPRRTSRKAARKGLKPRGSSEGGRNGGKD